MRHLQFQHHNRDDDGKDAVAEGFKTGGFHFDLLDWLPGPFSGRLRINVASDLAGEVSAENARLVRRTVKEQVDLPSPAKIRLKSVPLWRLALQFDALSALHRVADFHASIAKHPGIDDPVAAFKLSVATT